MQLHTYMRHVQYIHMYVQSMGPVGEKEVQLAYHFQELLASQEQELACLCICDTLYRGV